MSNLKALVFDSWSDHSSRGLVPLFLALGPEIRDLRHRLRFATLRCCGRSGAHGQRTADVNLMEPKVINVILNALNTYFALM